MKNNENSAQGKYLPLVQIGQKVSARALIEVDDLSSLLKNQQRYSRGVSVLETASKTIYEVLSDTIFEYDKDTKPVLCPDIEREVKFATKNIDYFCGIPVSERTRHFLVSESGDLIAQGYGYQWCGCHSECVKDETVWTPYGNFAFYGACIAAMVAGYKLISFFNHKT